MKLGIPYFDSKLENIPPLFFERTGLSPKTAEETAPALEALAAAGGDFLKLSPEVLDDLVLRLAFAPPPQAVSALVSRADARVMSLVWALFQFDYVNEDILSVLSGVTKAASYTKFQPAEGQMAFMKGFTQNPPAVLSSYILSRKEPLSAIPQKFGIIPEAPFFTDGLTRVLACAPPDFLKENHSFVDAVFRSGNIPVTVLIRYLDVIPAEDLSPEACLLVTDRLGAPGAAAGEFWSAYPPGMGQKIINWNKIYKLTLAYPPEGKKYRFFGKYSHKLADTVYDRETNVIKLIFGKFAVVDDLSDENEFIYCADPQAFPQKKNLKKTGSLTTAKDFIVKGAQAEYIRVSLTGLDKMYADEMFDNLLEM